MKVYKILSLALITIMTLSALTCCSTTDESINSNAGEGMVIKQINSRGQLVLDERT